jgi:hypothetical protein
LKSGKIFSARRQAVLKPPQPSRYPDCQACPHFAKRLDCGVFTAAFACPGAI